VASVTPVDTSQKENPFKREEAEVMRNFRATEELRLAWMQTALESMSAVSASMISLMAPEDLQKDDEEFANIINSKAESIVSQHLCSLTSDFEEAMDKTDLVEVIDLVVRHAKFNAHLPQGLPYVEKQGKRY